MRALRLLGVAAQAESLRLRREVRSAARSAVWGAGAAVFGIAALVMLHVAAWLALDGMRGPIIASLGVALADVVLMGLGLLLARAKADPVAQEALLVRRAALAEARNTPLLGDALGLIGWRSPVTVAGGFLAERLVRALTRR